MTSGPTCPAFAEELFPKAINKAALINMAGEKG
jgi:hypothetical protein